MEHRRSPVQARVQSVVIAAYAVLLVALVGCSVGRTSMGSTVIGWDVERGQDFLSQVANFTTRMMGVEPDVLCTTLTGGGIWAVRRRSRSRAAQAANAPQGRKART